MSHKYKHLHKNTSRSVDLVENTYYNIYISNYTKILTISEYYKNAHIIISNSVFLLKSDTEEHIILPNSLKYMNICFNHKKSIFNKNLYISLYCDTPNRILTTASNIIFTHTLNYIKNTKNNFLIENICNINVSEKYKSSFLLFKNTKTIKITKAILNILIFRYIFNLAINNCENLNLKYVKNVFNLNVNFCFFKNTNNILMNNFKYEYRQWIIINTMVSIYDYIIFTNVYELKLFIIDVHYTKYLSIACHPWIILIKLHNYNNSSKYNNKYNYYHDDDNQKKIMFKYTNKITLNYNNILLSNFQITCNNHTCILYENVYSNHYLTCKNLHTLKLHSCNFDIDDIVNMNINDLHSLTTYNVKYKITQIIKNISVLHINKEQLSYANKYLKTINKIKTDNCNECDMC